MIVYQIGGRYEQAEYEYALTEDEWRRMKTCKARVTLISPDTGERIVLRLQTQKEVAERDE